MSPSRLASSGALYALAAAALFGASTPLAKSLLGELSPWLLAGLLYLGSGIGLGAFGLARRLGGVRSEAALARQDLPWLALAVLIGGAIGPVLLMYGLHATPAAEAALLLNLESVLTLAIAWTVFREYVDLRLGLGAVAIIGGGLVLSWDGALAGTGMGALLIAGACLAWAIDNNLTRKIAGGDPVQIATIKGLAAGAANVALAAALGATWPAPGPALAGAAVGFVGYGASLALFVLALRHIGAARTGAYFATAPFVGAALAVLAFGEPVTTQLLLAALLMGVGVWLHLTERHEHEHVHEVITHSHRHVHDAHHQHQHAPDDPPGEPHAHVHTHAPLIHRHPHFPDLHHGHSHRAGATQAALSS